MKQLKITEWPESLNDQAGMLRLEPSDIESRSNLLFEPSFDSLDRFYGCVVELDHGHIFGLIRYENNPVPGTIIVMSEGSYAPAGGPEQFNTILSALGALPNDVIWHRCE